MGRNLAGACLAAVFVATAAGAVESAHSAGGASFSPAQAAAGRELYESRCVECHGADLSGGKGTPLKGPAFDDKWHGQTVRSLYAKIRATMPPEDPGTLSEGDALAVTAYLLSHNRRGLSGQATTTPADLADRRLELR